MWSPTITVESIDGVGTMNACTRVVVPNNRMRMFSDHSCTKFRTAAAPLLIPLFDWIPMNQQKGSLPPCLGEEVLRQVRDVPHTDGRVVQVFGRCVIGPVNDQRLADDVPARHKP